MVNRQSKRIKMDEIDEPGDAIHMELTDDPSTALAEIPDQEGKRSVQTETELNMQYIAKVFQDLEFANQKIYRLEHKLESLDLSEDAFKSDTKTLYFTGFPKADMLFKIFEIVMPYLSSRSVLSPFKQLILTLMKLRLNLPFKLLSYLFGIAPSTTSETFFRCIDILYAKFRKLVFWPEREILRNNMPACFKQNFGNRVTTIIDCFEIFTETPSGMLNAARCWSTYKHHSTVKFLIGITPQGTISYISEAWGGRTSDKFLTENCGFLNLLMPGDLILADRGFLIRDSVETLGAHLQIPAFTKGKSQLDPTDIETTRKIANVRIHVERLIGLLKRKFKICQEVIPISMLSASTNDASVLDKILLICSAFINLCPSVVPMD